MVHRSNFPGSGDLCTLARLDEGNLFLSDALGAFLPAPVVL